jgi:hypothetical protein
MTALTASRDTVQLASEGNFTLELAAATKIYAGSLVAINASGYAVPASASSALRCVGRAEKTIDNTSGSAGALTIEVKPGRFYFTCSGASRASRGLMAYVVFDNEVSLTDGSGLRPAAGRIVDYDGVASSPTYQQVAVEIGMPSLYDGSTAGGGVISLTIDGVVTANVADLTAFAVGTNTDGLTHTAGNIVALVAQATAAENGLYLVGTVAGGTAPLTRINQLASGEVIVQGQVRFSVQAGTVFAHSDWKNTAAGTIGTDDPAFFPAEVTITQALVAGAATITSIPVLSATKSRVSVIRSTANTCIATDGGYVLNGNPTAGALGTASVPIMASVLAGTLNNADISTLHITIANF